MDWNRIETKWYEMAGRLRQDLPTFEPVTVKMPAAQLGSTGLPVSAASSNEQASARVER
jgi:hypothetical protein